MLATKNYSYLAVQLDKIVSRWTRRMQHHALDVFGDAPEHGFADLADEHEHFSLDAEEQPAVGRSGLDLLGPMPRLAPRVVETSRAGWELGMQALASVVGLQLRFALRRWETFVRRRRFDELQSKVVLTLQSVSVPTPSPVAEHWSEMSAAAVITACTDELREHHALEHDAVASVPGESTSALGSRWHNTSNVEPEHVLGSQMRPNPAQDEEFVKSLSEDQARVDEIIKLAALLWESGSLVHVQPMALLRASLLVRFAERCQKHVMRETMQSLWKRCSLQRSVEELLAKGELVKRRDEAVTQMPAVSIHAMQGMTSEASQHPGDLGVEALGKLDVPNEHVRAVADKPLLTLDAHREMSLDVEPHGPHTRKSHETSAAPNMDAPVVVTQPLAAKPGHASFSSETAAMQSSGIHTAVSAVSGDTATHPPGDQLPEVRSETSGEESEINDDDLADLLG